MSRTNSTDTKFWQEFIQMYRENPCLWDANNTAFNDQSQRALAYGLLVEKLWEINEMADEETARKKIGAFQARFKRELKRLLKVANEKTDDQIYVPPNWCYDYYLKFLESQENLTDEIDDENGDTGTLDEISKSGHNKRKPEVFETGIGNKTPPWKKTKTDVVPETIKNGDSSNEEDDENFCNQINKRMQAFDPEQKRIARQLMSSVMSMAEKKQLQVNSRIV